MGRDGGTIGDYPNSTHGSDDRHKKTKQVVQKPKKRQLKTLLLDQKSCPLMPGLGVHHKRMNQSQGHENKNIQNQKQMIDVHTLGIGKIQKLSK